MALTEKKNIKKELREIAPLLEQQQGKKPFSVPDGYFDTLAQSIQKRKENTSTFLPSLSFSTKVVRYALNGLLLLVVLAASLFLANYTSKNNTALSQHEEALFQEHLAWYSEYQQEVYYDFLDHMDSYDEHIMEEEITMEDENLMEYIMYYATYHQQDLLDILPEEHD